MVFNHSLILDIDNTVLYTSGRELKGADRKDKYDFTLDMTSTQKAYVYLRPYLKEFLEYAFANFQSVSVWSLGNFSYISEILKKIHKKLKINLPFKFVFTAEDTPEKYYKDEGITMSIKDLNIIWDDPKYKAAGITKHNTIFIDDRADVLRETPGNHVPIKKYVAQKDDKELLKLILYLDKIGDKKKITMVKKKDWSDKDYVNDKKIEKSFPNIMLSKIKSEEKRISPKKKIISKPEINGNPERI
jgi:TFIIF-interacting CTD phosphatase-like protein